MKEWAEDRTQPWRKLRFDEYGFHATVQVKTIGALYYKAGKDRLLTIVLVRDVAGGRPDQMFYCTCLGWNVQKILSCYAARWSIEVTFHDCKQLLGFEDSANRKEKAVHRTAPFSLLLHAMTIAWFHNEGHHSVTFPERPWYTTKAEPSFADMLTTLRCRSWENQFRDICPASGPVKNAFDQLTQFLSLAG